MSNQLSTTNNLIQTEKVNTAVLATNIVANNIIANNIVANNAVQEKKIALTVPPIASLVPSNTYVPIKQILNPGIIYFPPHIFLPTAPAWFYSAINLLVHHLNGNNYASSAFSFIINERRVYDIESQLFKNFVPTQPFNSEDTVLFGSDVDPYCELGQTTLFSISFNSDSRLLYLNYPTDTSIEPISVDTVSDAITRVTYSGQAPVPSSVIDQMYTDMTKMPVWEYVKYCYTSTNIPSAVFQNDNTGNKLPNIPSTLLLEPGYYYNTQSFATLAGYQTTVLNNNYRVILDGTAVIATDQNTMNGVINPTIITAQTISSASSSSLNAIIIPVASSIVYNLYDNDVLDTNTSQFNAPTFYIVNNYTPYVVGSTYIYGSVTKLKPNGSSTISVTVPNGSNISSVFDQQNISFSVGNGTELSYPTFSVGDGSAITTTTSQLLTNNSIGSDYIGSVVLALSAYDQNPAYTGAYISYYRQTASILSRIYSSNNPTNLTGSAAVLSFEGFNQLSLVTQNETTSVSTNDNNGNGFSVQDDILQNKYYDYKYLDNALSVFENMQAENVQVYTALASVSSATNTITNTNGTPFAPNRAIPGTVEPMNASFGFVPSQDSLYIDETFFVFNFIPLGTFNIDPNNLPYAPNLWTQPYFLQMKNKYNPFTDIIPITNNGNDTNNGDNFDANALNIPSEIQPVAGQVPLFTYINVNNLSNNESIYAFNTVPQRNLYNNAYASLSSYNTIVVNEQTIPADLSSNVIYPPTELVSALGTTAAVGGVTNLGGNAGISALLNTSVLDTEVANNAVLLDTNNNVVTSIAYNALSLENVASKTVLLEQQNNANINSEKINTSILVPSNQNTEKLALNVNVNNIINPILYLRYFSIYGYTMFTDSESYLVQIVLSNNTNVPPFIVDKLDNLYDPYYAIFINLKTFVVYKVRIIVPFIIYTDAYNFAMASTPYITNTYNIYDNFTDPTVGYVSNSVYDTISFEPWLAATARDSGYLYTNVPYRNISTPSIDMELNETTQFKKSNMMMRREIPAIYFFVRDVNYMMEYKIMKSTIDETNTPSLLQCFGNGDLIPVPRKLNVQTYDINRKLPSHLYKFSQKFSDHNYVSTRAINIGNTPYFIGLANDNNQYKFISFSITANAGTSDISTSPTQVLTFPTEFYIVGETSTTQISVNGTTGGMIPLDSLGNQLETQFRVITYNNLVYLIRAVQNVPGLNTTGNNAISGSGLLIDTFVPTATGNLVLAQEARFKRSGLKFFGNKYTPTTLEDSLDNLDYTDINGNTFNSSTIFIPINPQTNVNNPLPNTTELHEYGIDATKGFIADITSFLGQVMWTFIYVEANAVDPTIVDGNGNPTGATMFSLQKLHFMYDPIATLFSPNDFSHKYSVIPKQQILGLTDAQLKEGIGYSSYNLVNNGGVPGYNNGPPQNISYNDPNIPNFGIKDILSVDGTSYNIEEGALQSDQAGQQLVSTVSSSTNMLVSVLFEYNDAANRDGTIGTSSKGLVCLNGYLSNTGYSFTSPDHFDVNDIRESQIPAFELFARLLNIDVSYFNLDMSLPRDFWTFRYDYQTPIGGPVPVTNYTSPATPETLPPALAPVDMYYANRYRTLVLNASDSLPDQMNIMDTHNSIVSIGVHQQNNVIGSLFLNKKAERNVAALGTASSSYLIGLPTKYDFYIFSRDHYETLEGASFQLIDNGYAIVINKNTNLAYYYVDTDGNYYESYTCITTGPKIGVETFTFNVKVALSSPANPNSIPPTPETPNNVNPQDIVTQINATSKIIYAVMGPTQQGLAPAYIPIHVSQYPAPTGATPIFGQPGQNGYSIGISAPQISGSSVVTPIQITNLYVYGSSGISTYPIAGSTTIALPQPKIVYYGSLQYGLDLTGNGLGSSGASFFSITNATTTIATNYIIYGGNTIVAAPIISTSIYYPISQTNNTFVLGPYDNNPGVYVIFTDPSIIVAQPQNYQILSQQIVLPAFQINFSNGENGFYTIYAQSAAGSLVSSTLYALPETTQLNTINSASYSLPITIGLAAPFYISVASPTAAMTVDFQVIPTILTSPNFVYTLLSIIDPDTTVILSPQVMQNSPIPLAAPLQTVSNSLSTPGGYSIATFPALPISNVSYGPSSPQYKITSDPLIFAYNNNVYLYDNFTNALAPVIVGNGNSYPVNQYQFIINDIVYIIDQNTNPYTVIFNGQTATMDVTNTQFNIDGNLYNYDPVGKTVTGQYNIMQSDVIVINDYIYQLDTINARVVGNGSLYPITTNGKIYSVIESDLGGNSQSYTVTKTGNSNTVTIGNIIYTLNNTSVTGINPLTGFIDTFPIVNLRRFVIGSNTYTINNDDTVTNITINSSYAINDDNTFTDTKIGETYTIYETIVIPSLNASNGPYNITSSLAFTLTSGPNSGKTYIIDEGMVYATYAVNTNVNGGQFTIGANTYTIGSSTSGSTTILSQVYGANDNSTYTINNNSFQINGINYTINNNQIVGNNSTTNISSNTFTLTANGGTGETYTIVYDGTIPTIITTAYPIRHNAVILSVNDDIYMYDPINNVMVGNGTTYKLGESFTAIDLNGNSSSFTLSSPTTISEKFTIPVVALPKYSFFLNSIIYNLTLDPNRFITAVVPSSGVAIFSNITINGSQYILLTDANGNPISLTPSTGGAAISVSPAPYSFTLGAVQYNVNTNSAGLILGVTNTVNNLFIPVEYNVTIGSTAYTLLTDTNGNPASLIITGSLGNNPIIIEEAYSFNMGVAYSVNFDNNGLITGVTNNATNTIITAGNMVIGTNQYIISPTSGTSGVPALAPLNGSPAIIVNPPSSQYTFNLGNTPATNYIIQNDPKGFITGIIPSNNQPIPISNIIINGTSYNIVTDTNAYPLSITSLYPTGVTIPIILNGSIYSFILNGDTYNVEIDPTFGVTGVQDTNTLTNYSISYTISLNTILYTINVASHIPTNITYTPPGIGQTLTTVLVMPVYTFVSGTQTYTVDFNSLGLVTGITTGSTYTPLTYSVVIPTNSLPVLYSITTNVNGMPTILTATNKNETINASNQFTAIDGNVYQIFNTEGYNFVILVSGIFAPTTQTGSPNSITYNFANIPGITIGSSYQYTITTQTGIVSGVTSTPPATDYFQVSPFEFIINNTEYLLFITSTGTYLTIASSVNPISTTFSVTETVNGSPSAIVYTFQPPGNNVLTASVATGSYPVLAIPTFFMNGLTFTIGTNVITDSNLRTYELYGTMVQNKVFAYNPTKLLTINGNIYLLDTSITPHQIVGNSESHPITVNLYGDGTLYKNKVNYSYFGEDDIIRKTPRYITGATYPVKTMDGGLATVQNGIASIYTQTIGADGITFTVSVPLPSALNPTIVSRFVLTFTGIIPVAVDCTLGTNASIPNVPVSPISMTTPIIVPSPSLTPPNSNYYYFLIGGSLYIITAPPTSTTLTLHGTFITISKTTYTVVFDSSNNNVAFLAYYSSSASPPVTFIPMDNMSLMTDISPKIFVDRGNAYQLDSLTAPMITTSIYKLYNSYAPAYDAYNPPPQVFSINNNLFMIDEYIIMNNETIASATSSVPANTGLNYVISVAGNSNIYPIKPKIPNTAITDGVFTIKTPNLINNSTINTTYEIFGTLNAVDTTDLSAGLVAGWITYTLADIEVNDFTPNFTQSFPFNFIQTYPLLIETGGYNAFSSYVTEQQIPVESYSGAYTQSITNSSSEIESLFTPQGDFTLEFWHTVPTSGITNFHPFQYNNLNVGLKNPNIKFIDLSFDSINNVYISLNATVMNAPNIMYPNLNDNWRHIALVYTQPYAISCGGAGYEVTNGTNFNFDASQNTAIAMTFAVDANAPAGYNYGLLYKGSGSSTTTTANIVCSYRLYVQDGELLFELYDNNGVLNSFPSNFASQGFSIQAGTYYQLIVTKTVNTGSGSGSSTDPFAPPISVGSLTNYQGSANFNLTGNLSTGGNVGMSGIKNPNIGNTGTSDVLANYLNNVGSNPNQTYTITFAIKQINNDGSYGSPTITTQQSTNYINQNSLTMQSTGADHLVFGEAFDDNNSAFPFVGQIRKIYLLKNSIDPNPSDDSQKLENLSLSALIGKGLIGQWNAAYDPNNVVNNAIDPATYAISTNSYLTTLVPIIGHEFEGSQLYINAEQVSLSLITNAASLPSGVIVQGTNPPSGPSQNNYYCIFNSSRQLKLQEISIWSMARQNYQIMDDIFGRLNYTLQPNLQLYFSGSITLTSKTTPYLQMSQYIDNIPANTSGSYIAGYTNFSDTSIDLAGCPEIGRCGPLITPNLYTPPIFGITIADTVPSIATYSVTLGNGPTGLAGEINEAYVYTSGGNLNIYVGKKIGDLTLQWVSQEQGDVQILGYIEGAPPCPMANLTLKPNYMGATSLSMTATSSLSFKYSSSNDFSDESKWVFSDNGGFEFGLGEEIAPIGFGVHTDKTALLTMNLNFGAGGTWTNSSDDTSQGTASVKLDENDKFSIKLQGALAPITNDQYMASINTLTTANNTPGNPSAKTAILPNPNFGGFTSNNPPTALPKTLPTDEKFGTRVFAPSPYGQAYVTSSVLDVYQQTLVQTNTVYGFVKIPNPNIPPDNNIVSFRINSQYIRPGCLDGVIGYVYNPTTTATGLQTYTTSTGQMNVLNDQNFSQSDIGNNASYMKVIEAYQLKKQIDLEAYNTVALYQTAYNNSADPSQGLTNSVDFYNEYVWSSRGATEEIKHNYTTSYDEVYTTSTTSTNEADVNFNAKIGCVTVTVIDAKLSWTDTSKLVTKYSIDNAQTNTFDMTISFDGIENDTQMRNASNNDAHFVLNNNSQFNTNNQSGLNLVSGSDSLVYNIVPSVQSGAGLPTSNNLDDAFSFTQPLPSYVSGSATGLTGNLEPYDRPGKTKLFRTCAYFLQPKETNNDTFWNTVIDPIWLANSTESDADAIRSAQNSASIPWRILYRVTYSERFLPPITSGLPPIPVITPLVAVPVTNGQSLKYSPLNINPNAGVVLIIPTSDGSDATLVQNQKMIANVMKFDTTSINWGGTKNGKLLTALITTAMGVQNNLKLSASYPSNSIKSYVAINDVKGTLVYTAYTDNNGVVYNVSALGPNLTIIVDVNSNPIQYTLDGTSYTAIQANFVPSPDGTIMYYIQPPITTATNPPAQYDPTLYDYDGNYDTGNQGTPISPQFDTTQEWTYSIVSGYSSNLTSSTGVSGQDPFIISGDTTDPITNIITPGFAGFNVAANPNEVTGNNGGYVIVQTTLQYPNLNTSTETLADLNVYKSVSLFDLLPTGDIQILQNFIQYLYPNAPFITQNESDIQLVFPRNIIVYFNSTQQAILPQ